MGSSVIFDLSHSRRLHKIEEHARLALREHSSREAEGQRPLLGDRELVSGGVNW